MRRVLRFTHWWITNFQLPRWNLGTNAIVRVSFFFILISILRLKIPANSMSLWHVLQSDTWLSWLNKRNGLYYVQLSHAHIGNDIVFIFTFQIYNTRDTAEHSIRFIKCLSIAVYYRDVGNSGIFGKSMGRLRGGCLFSGSATTSWTYFPRRKRKTVLVHCIDSIDLVEISSMMSWKFLRFDFYFDWYGLSGN